MKKKSLLLTALATLGLTTATMAQNVPSYVPTNGLVGWWPFNGNANDESGNGNNGTVNGATLTSDRFGNNNMAYMFNGNSNKIQVADANSLDFTNNYTVSGWYLTNSLNQLDQAILGKGRIGGGTGYQLLVNSNTNPPKHQFGYNNGAGINGGSTTPVNNSNLTGWHLLTGTYDGSQAKIYLDGLLMTTVTVTYSLQNSTEPLLFGNETNSLNRFFNGKLDDIGIWNRALTQQEITDLYNGNICYQTITVTDTLLINMGITGFNPVTYNNTIKIFPNPTNDHITIDYGNFASLSGYQLLIENSLGQQVFQTSINQQSNYLSLNNWGGNGLYFVRIIDPQGNTVDIRKIVLQ
jgi:hypothetical protein